MSSNQDIHAIKEVLKVLFDIAVPIIKQAKADGKFALPELVSFVNSEDFKADIVPAYKDISLVPGEFKNFGIINGLDLTWFLIPQAKQLLAALEDN